VAPNSCRTCGRNGHLLILSPSGRCFRCENQARSASPRLIERPDHPGAEPRYITDLDPSRREADPDAEPRYISDLDPSRREADPDAELRYISDLDPSRLEADPDAEPRLISDRDHYDTDLMPQPRQESDAERHMRWANEDHQYNMDRYYEDRYYRDRDDGLR
jgi:hypothetical protein